MTRFAMLPAEAITNDLADNDPAKPWPEISGPDANSYWVAEACGLSLPHVAAEIVACWRSLRPGEQSRCHLPPVVLRFLDVNGPVCEASVCWKCDNIFGRDRAGKFHFEFDAARRAARRLRSLVIATVGEEEFGSGAG